MKANDLAQSSLSLKELLRYVKQELVESQREREASGEAALFEVEGLILEVNFIVIKSKAARGGIDFKVLTLGGINVGGGKDYQEHQVHKITLTLKTVPRKRRAKDRFLGQDPIIISGGG
jgi:hypothetical protein